MYEVRLLLVGLESQAEVLFHHIAEFSGREDFEALGVSEEEADEFAVYDDVQFEDCGAVIRRFNYYLAAVDGLSLVISQKETDTNIA